MSKLIYQSPINLVDEIKVDLFKQIRQSGENCGAIFNAEEFEYIISPDNINKIKIGNKIYQWISYHFHIASEHLIHGKRFPAEYHQLFMELDNCEEKNELSLKYYRNNCPCNAKSIKSDSQVNNMLVVARMIEDNGVCQDLRKMQLSIPSNFYIYDGARTSPDFTVPIRWIIGKNSIKMSLKQILPIAQNARETQALDGRIIIYQSS